MLLKDMKNQMENWVNRSTTFTTWSTPCSMEPALCPTLPPTTPSFWLVLVISWLTLVWRSRVVVVTALFLGVCRCSILSPMPFLTSGWRSSLHPMPPSRMRWPPLATTGTTTWFPSFLQSLMRSCMSHLSRWDIPMPFPLMVSVKLMSLNRLTF